MSSPEFACKYIISNQNKTNQRQINQLPLYVLTYIDGLLSQAPDIDMKFNLWSAMGEIFSACSALVDAVASWPRTVSTAFGLK